MSETSGAIAGAGASATRGLAVPALNLSLTAEVIAGLLQTSTAVIVATPSAGTVRYILGNDGRFTKATNSQFAALSPRAFPMQEGTLATAWSRALERQDTQHTFVFALRFSDRAAAMIVNEQFGALKKRGIDFAKALAAGHTVVTDGVIDADTLNFHIVGVKEIP